MTLFKRFVRSRLGRRAIVAAGIGYLNLVRATSRWRTVGAGTPERLWAAKQPFVVCFWHERLLLMPFVWDYAHPFSMLNSTHVDGQIIAEITGHFGVGSISGSSTKGGTAALRALLSALKSGTSVGLTPDGPRGPRLKASAGILQLARLGRVPIVPLAVATSRRRVLGTWDRFQVNLPFSRGVYVWGEPIEVPADAAGLETARLALEAELNRVSAEADRQAGHVPDPAQVAGA